MSLVRPLMAFHDLRMPSVEVHTAGTGLDALVKSTAFRVSQEVFLLTPGCAAKFYCTKPSV